MGTFRSVALVVALAFVLSACQSDGSGSDPGNPDQVEVLTSWALNTDQTALYDLVDVFEKQHPELDFIDASVRGEAGDEARAAIAARLAAGNPPDVFQAAAGAGLSEYVAAGQLQALDDFYAQNGLDSAYRPELLDLLRVEGTLYAVPIEVHRVNVLWANNSLLEQAGVDPTVEPATVDAWLADLEVVRASGVEYPLAVGDAFTQAQLFESVLIADFGESGYQALWKSVLSWDAERLSRAIDHYAALLEFTDPSTRAQDWNRVTAQVVFGNAAYQVMADYAKQRFDRVGFVVGDDYTAMAAPGTAGVFDALADSFALPVGIAHADAAGAWLLTVSSDEGQKAFNVTKGSIPARADAWVGDYEPYQQEAITSLQLDAVVPSAAHGLAADRAWTLAFTAAVSKFGDDGRPVAFANALVAAATEALD